MLLRYQMPRKVRNPEVITNYQEIVVFSLPFTHADKLKKTHTQASSSKQGCFLALWQANMI